jgi:hypothetical protein
MHVSSYGNLLKELASPFQQPQTWRDLRLPTNEAGLHGHSAMARSAVIRSCTAQAQRRKCNGLPAALTPPSRTQFESALQPLPRQDRQGQLHGPPMQMKLSVQDLAVVVRRFSECLPHQTQHCIAYCNLPEPDLDNQPGQQPLRTVTADRLSFFLLSGAFYKTRAQLSWSVRR